MIAGIQHCNKKTNKGSEGRNKKRKRGRKVRIRKSMYCTPVAIQSQLRTIIYIWKKSSFPLLKSLFHRDMSRPCMSIKSILNSHNGVKSLSIQSLLRSRRTIATPNCFDKRRGSDHPTFDRLELQENFQSQTHKNVFRQSIAGIASWKKWENWDELEKTFIASVMRIHVGRADIPSSSQMRTPSDWKCREYR